MLGGGVARLRFTGELRRGEGCGLEAAGWDTAVVLVPVQVCPCSCTELCAETSRIPCLRAP